MSNICMSTQTIAFCKKQYQGKLREIKKDVFSACDRLDIPRPKVWQEKSAIHFELVNESCFNKLFSFLSKKYK